MDESQEAVEKLSPEEENGLREWEITTIDLFVRAAQLIGIPKSMGQIYGLLFCSIDPLPMDTIVAKLEMSKGSASQGLRTLRQIGAVHIEFIVGDRRDHYVAELKLRRLVSGFLENQLTPHLNDGTARLDYINKLIEQEDEEIQSAIQERLKIIGTWQDKSANLIPWVRKFL